MTKLSWQVVEADFEHTYISISPMDPSLIMAAAMFDSLQLSPAQQLEDFHSVIWEKGKKLGKPERDLLNKFIDRLPPQLAFFVRAGRCSKFSDALNIAKTGEAFGYRGNTISSANSIGVVKKGDNPSLSSLTQEVQNLSSIVQQLVLGKQQQSQQYNVSAEVTEKSCFACGGIGHVKRACSWYGRNRPDPQAMCQLCSQI